MGLLTLKYVPSGRERECSVQRGILGNEPQYS